MLLREHVKTEFELEATGQVESEDQSPSGCILVYGSPAIANLLRLAMPALSSHIIIVTIHDDDEAAAKSNQAASDGGTAVGVSTATQIRSVPRRALADAALDVQALISVGPLSQLDSSLLRHCNITADAMAVDLSDNEQTLQNNRSALNEFTWLGRSQLEVARLAASFQFWTNHVADPALIHEYLDEYSQW